MSKFSLVTFQEIDSTNDYIKRNYKMLDHMMVVTSNTQTNGKGRSNHKWMSEDGNLYFSVLLKKDIMYSHLFDIMIKISTSIIRGLSNLGINAQIKYPNDILVNKKKIAGILIESAGLNNLDYVVVGVGINVNQIYFGELQSKATSIKNVLDTELEIAGVLNSVLTEFAKDDHTHEEYVKHSIIIGKKINYNDARYDVLAILDDGRLLLQREDVTLKVGINEISFEEIYEWK